MTVSAVNTIFQPKTVTFDSNVIENVLDKNKCSECAERIIFDALQNGILKGFVAQAYFDHDAIKKDYRIKTLCEDIEVTIPTNPILVQCGIGLNVAQASTIEPDSFHNETIEQMRQLKMEVLAFKRKFWPEVTIDLPIKTVPADYDARAEILRGFIEEELHCGFYRFKEFLEKTVGNHGSDISLLFQLKDVLYNKKRFNSAFSEAGDGDALIAHYGYGIEYFCTNDRAAKAGEQSVFSQANKQALNQRFGIEIISPIQLAGIIFKREG